jgi:hypothetical protein
MIALAGRRQVCPADEFVLILSSSDGDHAELQHPASWRMEDGPVENVPRGPSASGWSLGGSLPARAGRRRLERRGRTAGSFAASADANCDHIAPPWKDLGEEVLRLGGYDVLSGPFRAREVLRCVNSARKCYRAERRMVDQCSRSEEAPCLVQAVGD